jgi:hypothetical protein
MIIGTTNLVINDIGAVFNVRIEGDTDENLFYTDATNSRVGIGIGSPTEKLDVVGKIKLSDNLVIGTSGKGIDFSATAGTGTSELLADYEEGTWTATLEGATADPTTPVVRGGVYTKIGRQVSVRAAFVNVDTTGGSGNMFISGLPYTPSGGGDDHYIGSCESFGLNVPNKYNVPLAVGGSTNIFFQSPANNAGWNEPTLTAGASKYLNVFVTYFV